MYNLFDSQSIVKEKGHRLVSLPEALVDWEQHLIAQAYLLRIFRFAGHGCEIKRKASRITN